MEHELQLIPATASTSVAWIRSKPLVFNGNSGTSIINADGSATFNGQVTVEVDPSVDTGNTRGCIDKFRRFKYCVLLIGNEQLSMFNTKYFYWITDATVLLVVLSPMLFHINCEQAAPSFIGTVQHHVTRTHSAEIQLEAR